MTLEFFIDGKIPAGTHQMKKVCVIGGKPRFYEPANLKSAREYYMARLKEFAPKKPIPKNTAIELHTVWFYKPTKKKGGTFAKTTAPDTDNLVKLLKDCMTACGFWVDDAQVAGEAITKIWDDEREGIWVQVVEVDSEIKDFDLEVG